MTKLKGWLSLVVLLCVWTVTAAEYPLGTNGILAATLPKGWFGIGRAAKAADGNETYGLSFHPTNGVKARLILDFAFVTNGAPDKAEVRKDVLRICEPIVEKSVEKKANLKEFSLPGGVGAYCVFTDASLVGKEVKSGEFKALGIGMIHPGTNQLGTVSLWADDPTGKEFQDMVSLVNSMHLKPARAR